MTHPLEYEIRVSGTVPDAVLIEIEGARAQVEPVQTVLRGLLPDQAALHGVIVRLQQLGVELIEVRRMPSGPAGAQPHPAFDNKPD